MHVLKEPEDPPYILPCGTRTTITRFFSEGALTVIQASREFGIPVKTLRDWLWKGSPKVPFIKRGRVYLISRALFKVLLFQQGNATLEGGKLAS
jgi:hypothetical protein